MPTNKLSLATRLHGKLLIDNDLNKRSAKRANKSTLVAGVADTQLGSSCVLAPLATNVDLWKPITTVAKYHPFHYVSYTANVIIMHLAKVSVVNKQSLRL